MLKKLASLFLSLLVCLSLLPGRARAAEPPDDPRPPVILEPLDPETPEDPEPPEEPVMPLSDPGSGDFPGDYDTNHG